MNTVLKVSPGGGGGFATIGEALARAGTLPEGGSVRVCVAPGTYREKLRLMRPGLELIGEGKGPDEVRIEWDDHARRPLPDGEPMGTFNSYVVYTGAPGIRIENLTVENVAGDGRRVGQAVALYADSDALVLEHCRLVARQDTLCTGPLPRDPVPKGVNLVHPVAGLGDDDPALPFRQIYRNCLIAGDVDFIFGSAAALFENCEIRSLDRGGDDTFIAAPSTWPGQSTGFLFLGCALSFGPGETAPGTEPEPAITAATAPVRGKVYLGRPWRPCAKACFADCFIGEHIAAEGWHDWDKPEARVLSYFGERGSYGPGAGSRGRASWARQPLADEIEAMYREITSFSRE